MRISAQWVRTRRRVSPSLFIGVCIFSVWLVEKLNWAGWAKFLILMAAMTAVDFLENID